MVTGGATRGGPMCFPRVEPILFIARKKRRTTSRNPFRDPLAIFAMPDPANPYRALEIRGTVARIDGDPTYRFINAASQKYLNRDATSEETGPADERVVIIVGPERVIPFPS